MLDEFVSVRCTLGGKQRVEPLYDSLRQWYASKRRPVPTQRALGANFSRLGFPLDSTKKYRLGLTLKPAFAAEAAMPPYTRAVEEFLATMCEEGGEAKVKLLHRMFGRGSLAEFHGALRRLKLVRKRGWLIGLHTNETNGP